MSSLKDGTEERALHRRSTYAVKEGSLKVAGGRVLWARPFIEPPGSSHSISGVAGRPSYLWLSCAVTRLICASAIRSPVLPSRLLPRRFARCSAGPGGKGRPMTKEEGRGRGYEARIWAGAISIRRMVREAQGPATTALQQAGPSGSRRRITAPGHWRSRH